MDVNMMSAVREDEYVQQKHDRILFEMIETGTNQPSAGSKSEHIIISSYFSPLFMSSLSKYVSAAQKLTQTTRLLKNTRLTNGRMSTLSTSPLQHRRGQTWKNKARSSQRTENLLLSASLSVSSTTMALATSVTHSQCFVCYLSQFDIYVLHRPKYILLSSKNISADERRPRRPILCSLTLGTRTNTATPSKMPVHFGGSSSLSRGVRRGDFSVSFASAVEIIGTSVRDTINPEVVINSDALVDDFDADDVFAEEDEVVAPAPVVEIVVENFDEEEEAAHDAQSASASENGTTNTVPTTNAATNQRHSLEPPLRFPPRASSLRWRTGPQPLARRANAPGPTAQQNIPLTPPPAYTPPEYRGDNDDEIECILRSNPVPGYLDDVAPPRYDVYDPRAHDVDIILEDLFDNVAEWTARRREAVVDAWNALTYNSPRGPGQLRDGGDRRRDEGC